MPVSAAEPGAEEVLRAVPCDRDSRGPASEAENVQVVVLDSLAGGKVIVNKRRADADNLVGNHGRTYTAATD